MFNVFFGICMEGRNSSVCVYVWVFLLLCGCVLKGCTFLNTFWITHTWSSPASLMEKECPLHSSKHEIMSAEGCVCSFPLCVCACASVCKRKVHGYSSLIWYYLGENTWLRALVSSPSTFSRTNITQKAKRRWHGQTVRQPDIPKNLIVMMTVLLSSLLMAIFMPA